MRTISISRNITVFISIILLLSFATGCQGGKKTKAPSTEVPPIQGRLSFGDPQPVTDKGDIFAPYLTTDPEGRVLIGYIVQTGSIHRVFFVRSENGGDNFTGKIQLSDKDGLKDYGVQMASLNGSLYAVWANRTDVGTKLAFRKSVDGGKNFTRESHFNGLRFPRRFAIAGQALNPIIFYTEGEKWQSNLVLNRGFDPGREKKLIEGESIKGIKVATSSNGIYALTLSRPPPAGGGEFILLGSTDGGKTFIHYRLFNALMFPVYKNSYDIAVTREDTVNRLHMIWLERDSKGVRLMYARSLDEISKWTVPIIIASVPRPEEWLCDRPLLATDGLQSVFIAYNYLNASSDEKTYPLVYKLSEDGGETFNEEAVITEEVTNPGTITGAMNQHGTIHIAWDDEDHAEPGERRIYYIKGTVK